MNTYFLQLTPLDTLFFRGPQRFDAGAGGASYLSSQFPPNPGTVFGALNRNLLKEKAIGAHGTGGAHGTDGTHGAAVAATNTDPLTHPDYFPCRGPWLYHAQHQLLFPAPAALLKLDNGQIAPLVPSATKIQCDLGNVHLPVLHMPASTSANTNANTHANNAKPRPQSLGDAWLKAEDYQKWLNGQAELIKAADILTAKDLWHSEPRTGLERGLHSRVAIEGQLYSAAHVRTCAELSLLAQVTLHRPELLAPRYAPPAKGANPHWPSRLPLGGEGRSVWLHPCAESLRFPAMPEMTVKNDRIRFTVQLITPGIGEAWQLAPNPNGAPCRIHPSIPGELLCAALPRPLRIGGFMDMKRTGSGQTGPLPLKNACAAGSVWWGEAEMTDLAQLQSLHDTCIGDGHRQGYGHILIGRW